MMFICTKVKFVSYSFLEILQRFSKLVTFKYFGCDCPYSPILIISTCRKVCLTSCKNSISCLHSFLRYCKDISKFLFWVLRACLDLATKNNDICFKKTLMLIFMQKIKVIFQLFLATILRACYFRYFRHGLPPITKTTVSSCREFWFQFRILLLLFLKLFTPHWQVCYETWSNRKTNKGGQETFMMWIRKNNTK